MICITAAIVCAAIRTQRPEMAMVISLAAGVFVILMLWNGITGSSGLLERIRGLVSRDETLYGTVLKAAGIAIIAEMGVQICTDAGEKTLAGRIALASRVSMLILCAPMLERILDYIGEIPL